MSQAYLRQCIGLGSTSLCVLVKVVRCLSQSSHQQVGTVCVHVLCRTPLSPSDEMARHAHCWCQGHAWRAQASVVHVVALCLHVQSHLQLSPSDMRCKQKLCIHRFVVQSCLRHCKQQAGTLLRLRGASMMPWCAPSLYLAAEECR